MPEVCFRLPNIFRRGDSSPGRNFFAYHILSGAFRAPWGNASGGEVLSLITYYLGAFRAPCRAYLYFLVIPSPRGTFVNSDKSTQKRRKPYGLDPLACSFRFRLRLHIHEQVGLCKGDIFHLNLGQPLAAP